MPKNDLKIPFFSKNTLFFGKYLPGNGEFGEKSLPGGRNLVKNFGPGIPDSHPCFGND